MRPARKRPSHYRTLSFEGLETRLVPATVSQSGTILSLVLSDNENLAISTAAGGVYTMNLTGGTFSDGGGITAPTTFTGFGGSAGALTTGGVLSQISVTDGGSVASVTFNPSTQSYQEFFNVFLDDSSAGGIAFNGASTFNGGLTAETNGASAGSVTVAAAANVQVNGNLVLLSGDTQNVAFNGTLVITGASTINSITAQGSGTVIFDNSGISLDGTTTVEAGGGITQTQPFSTFGTTFFDSTGPGGPVILSNAGNTFFGAVGGTVIGGNAFTIVNSVGTTLEDISLDTGPLAVTSAGTIFQNGSATNNGIRSLGTATGTSTFTLTAAGSINLASAPNNFGGGLVTFAGGAFVADQRLRDTSPLAALPTTFTFVAPANNTTFQLDFDNASIAITSPLTIAGAASNISLTSGGDITQSGAGTLSARFGTFTLLRSGQISLPLANSFAGGVSFSTPDADATSTVLYTGGAGVVIASSNLGLGTFTINAAGNITQTGPITQKRGAGKATFNPGANNVTLSNGSNAFEGGVAIGSGAQAVNVVDTSSLATFPTFPSSATVLNVRFDNAPVVIPNIDAGTAPALTNLTVRGAGIYQQPGTRIVIPNQAGNLADFEARNGANQGFPILLNSPANDFPGIASGGIRLRTAGPNAVEVVDATDLNFFNATNVGNGTFKVITTGGAITQTGGTITQAINADLTTFNAGANPILLTANNALRGFVVLNTLSTASVNNQSQNLTLGGSLATPFTVGSNLTATVTGGFAITQYPGAAMTVTGKATFTAGTVTLDNVGNVFNGQLNFGGSTTVTVRDSDANGVELDTFTMAGGFLTVHSTGPITQSASGGIVVGSATFDAGSNPITLNTASNNFSGNVSLTSLGAGASTITDLNFITLSSVKLGSGDLTVNAGATAANTIIFNAPITQTGAGTVTLNAPFAGSALQMVANGNNVLGRIVVNVPTASIVNRGNIDLTGSTITSSLSLASGGVVTLPAALTLTGTFDSSARQTNVANDIQATQLQFFGMTDITASVTLTATTGSISFTGDVFNNSPLNLSLLAAGGNVNLNSGRWEQGFADLTITQTGTNVNNFNIGNGSSDAVFHMVQATLRFTGSTSFGSVNVGALGTFEVGGNASGTPTVTVDNSSGNINFLAGSSLLIDNNDSVSGSSIPGQLRKAAAATGNINIAAGSVRLIGAGLMPSAPTVVLDAGAGRVLGFFKLTVDPNNHNLPVDFLMGADIARATYGVSTVSVIRSGTEVASFTAFQADHDKFTVTVTGGLAAGLVVNQDLNGNFGIVVRRANVTTTLTLATSATPGDGLTTNVVGIAVNGRGAVTINAPTVDLGNSATSTPGEIRVPSHLASLSMHDSVSSSKISAGDISSSGIITPSLTTSIAARLLNNTTIDLDDVLSKLTAKQVSGGTITAERFGTITVTALPTLSGLNTGDFSATLINRNVLNSTAPALSLANIADHLQGSWHLNGRVGTVNAKNTSDWNLGGAAALFTSTPNIGLLTSVTSLNLGVVSGSNRIHATGKVGTLAAISTSGSNIVEAGSFGTIKTTGNAAIGDVGDLGFFNLTARANSGGVALASLNVAGNISGSSTFVIDNGNIGSITVGRSAISAGFTLASSATSGAVSSIQVGAWSGSSLDAKSLGSLRAVGNVPAAIFGDFAGTIILHGTAGAATSTLGSLAARNIAGTITVENGSIGSLTASRSMSAVNLSALAAAGGTIGTISAADWNSGSLIALSVGTLRTTGAAQTAPASVFLAGDLTSVPMTLFRATGTGSAIGTLSVAGSLTLPFIRADQGIGAMSVGRDVNGSAANSVIQVNNVVPGASSVGRIGSLSAGRWGNSTALNIAANAIGSINIRGFTQAESGTANVRPGDFANSSVTVRGGPVGIGSFSAAGSLSNTVLIAPFGISSVAVTRSLTNTVMAVDNPGGAFLGALGRLGSLTAGEVSGGKTRANIIGTFKVIGFSSLFPFGSSLNGDFVGADITATAASGTALGTLALAGNLDDGTMNVPGSVGSISVGQNLGGNSGTFLGAAFAANARLGSFKAGAVSLGLPVGRFLDLVSNSLGSFGVTGNASFGIAGALRRSLITVTGSSAGVGIGSVTVSGTVSDSNLNVFAGNVNAVTVGAFVSSDLLVGFHFLAANDINNTGVTVGTFNSTLFTLGSFRTTTAFSSAAGNILSASFIDSNLIAARLGAITLPGVDGTPPAGSDTVTFGVGFKQVGGARGTLTANGAVRQPDTPLNLGAFRYHGL